MACGCSKNKDKDNGKNMKKKKKKNNKNKPEKHELLYIMNPNCGWCKKADPVVEELIKDGYDIISLDMNIPEQAERANAAKAKHKAQCGTPLFLDAETGNIACGFREKDVLEKWAKGEEMPAPAPRPNPNDADQQKEDPKFASVKFEYIWLDGSQIKNIRSKVRYQRLSMTMLSRIGWHQIVKMIPPWSFDGSSTGQADVENSDCILNPVRIIPNPMETDSFETGESTSYIVLCEVGTQDNNPHESNTRYSLVKSVGDSKTKDLIVGFEQEYVMTDPITGKPLGWEKYKDETPQLSENYYCGVGSETVIGRKLADSHANMCNKVGVSVAGTNAEVMLSQWEYQTTPKPVLMAADDVIFSRFILQRLAEDMNISISYNPKLMGNEWSGSGGHINFSTDYMRRESDIAYLNLMCGSMEKYHEESLLYYGQENDKRLTGDKETSSIDEFTWGESDRTASIRIPSSTIQNGGKGYLEDRRPAANIDPYEAFEYLLKTVNEINVELEVVPV